MPNNAKRPIMRESFIIKILALPCFDDGTGGDEAAEDVVSRELSFFGFLSTASPCKGLESPFSSRFDAAGERESFGKKESKSEQRNG